MEKKILRTMRPLRGTVVVKPCEGETMSPGGIALPESVKAKAPTKGVVIAVGTGRVLQTGQVLEPQVAPGDTVVFNKYDGCEFEEERVKYKALPEDSILVVL